MFHELLKPGTLVRKKATANSVGVVRYFGPIPELAAKNKKKKNITKREQNEEQEQKEAATEEEKEKPSEDLFVGIEWIQSPIGKNDGTTPCGKRYFEAKKDHGSFIKLPAVLNSTSSEKNQEHEAEEEEEQEKENIMSSPTSKILSLFENCLILPESPLVDVLIDRFSPTSVFPSASSSSSPPPLASTSPFFFEAETKTFPNVTMIGCEASPDLQIVSSAGDRRLTSLFPNLKIVSVASTLIVDWSQAFEIARLLPKIETLNLSDNAFDCSTFPSSSSVSSSSLKTLNVTSTQFDEKHFFELFALFPHLTELFCAKNKMKNLPSLPSFNSSVIESVRKLKSLTLAQNSFENLDSLFHAASTVTSSAAASFNNSNNNEKLEMQLTQLNVNECFDMTEIVTAEFLQQQEEKGQNNHLLFPNLNTLCIRDAAIGRWDSLQRFFDKKNNFVGGRLSDVSLAGISVLTPEFFVGSPREKESCPMMKKLHELHVQQHRQEQEQEKQQKNNNKKESEQEEEYDKQEQQEKLIPLLDDRERRRLCVAMLPETVARLNNTSIEKTDWFGKMKENSTRPELRNSKKFAASLFGRIDKSERDLLLPERAKEILQEFQDEIELEQKARAEIVKRGPMLFQNEIKLKLFVLEASVGEVFEMFENAFEDQIFDASQKSTSSTTSSSSSSKSEQNQENCDPSPSSATSSAASSGMNNNNNSNNNTKKKNPFLKSGILTADVRTDVQQLELSVVEFLNLDKYRVPKTHETEDMWSIVEAEIHRWKKGPENSKVSFRKSAEVIWRQVYHVGSLALFYVDSELLGNEGAVARGVHVRFLSRPQSVLHSLRINDGDLLFAVFRKD